MNTFIAAGCSALLGGTAVAGPPAVDGTRDAVYGPVASLQNNSTGFGDNTSDHVGYAFGSELDGGSAVIAGGSLFIHLGGNIESNHNKIELFIDARAGGQNSILGINPDVSFSALQRMGDDGTGNGLTFDDGIEPDLYLSITCGDNDTDSGIVSYIDYAELRTYGDGVGDYAGSGSSYNLEGVDYIEPSVGNYGIRVAINNSNIGGVIGGDGENEIKALAAARRRQVRDLIQALLQRQSQAWSPGLRMSCTRTPLATWHIMGATPSRAQEE